MKLARSLRYGLGRAVRDIGQRPGLAAWTVGAVAAALLVVGLAHLVARNVDTLAGSWRGGAHMLVFLEEGTADDRAERIAVALRSLGGIERIDYVTPAAAEKRLRSALGDHEELLDGVDPGVVPGSLEITLAAGVRDVAAAHPLTERLRATPGVEDVELVGDWVDQVAGILAALRRGAWLFAMIAAAACVFVVAAAVRLRIQPLGDEARAAALVGAQPRFLRGPLVANAVIQGAAGAALGIAALWLVFCGVAPAVERALGDAVGSAGMSFLSPAEAAALIGVGAGLALFGGVVATGRRALV